MTCKSLLSRMAHESRIKLTFFQRGPLCVCLMSYDEYDFIHLFVNFCFRSFETGPSSDHTLKNAKGYYVYIESSYPNKKGKCQSKY